MTTRVPLVIEYPLLGFTVKIEVPLDISAKELRRVKLLLDGIDTRPVK
jgi:hypothetical protein